MTKERSSWFAADPEGLRLILERRGLVHAIFELYANAADTEATEVTIVLKPVPNRPLCELAVVDNDPTGFVDLKHAYTLFAESPKKADATKSGRFDLGEKLVLALCTHAQITSTTGAVYFAEGGERWTNAREKTKVGTRFWGELRMTRDQYDAAREAMQRLLVRPGLRATFNGEALQARTPLRSFGATLTTELGGQGEPLRRSARKTTVRVYEPRPAGAWLYELGIPVVPLGDDAWDVEVMQRVPLNLERDNVTPGFLREVRVAVLNAMQSEITAEQSSASWLDEAAGDGRSADEAVRRLMTLRYGEHRVGADPSDREAERTAASHGAVVVQPLSLPSDLRKRVKEVGANPPAGRKYPTPKPFTPGGAPLKMLPEAAWTDGMRRMSAYVQAIGEQLLRPHDVECLSVAFADDPGWGFRATYERERHSTLALVRFNVALLGPAWFERDHLDVEVNRLVIHELAHECGHHLEHSYHEACCRFGAHLARLVRDRPEMFR